MRYSGRTVLVTNRTAAKAGAVAARIVGQDGQAVAHGLDVAHALMRQLAGDLAATVAAFPASPEASCITAAQLVVDGGQTISAVGT